MHSAAHPISFEKPDKAELEEEIKSTAFSVEDVKRIHPDINVAIDVLEPSKQPSSSTALSAFSLAWVRASFQRQWAEQEAQRLPAVDLIG